MQLDEKNTSRRDFLKGSAGMLGAVGILAFPPGITRAMEAASGSGNRITQTYPRTKVANVYDLREGVPLDFQYPQQEHSNLLVKLGKPALLGVGDDKDIVAFSYLCSHMGCPLNGLFRPDHSMLGPCPCHFSRFDLAKGGILVLGQATQSLAQIVLEVQYGEIYAVGVTGLVYGYANNLEGGAPLAKS